MNENKEYGGPPKEITMSYAEHQKYFGGLAALIEKQVKQKKKRIKK